MSERNRQLRWRTGALAKERFSITVHLSPSDAATLDAIAVELYNLVPHEPHEGIDGSEIYPSRAEAVRELCRRWRREHGSKGLTRFKRLREKLSTFWRDEAVWRACNERSDRSKKPKPPWRG